MLFPDLDHELEPHFVFPYTGSLRLALAMSVLWRRPSPFAAAEDSGQRLCRRPFESSSSVEAQLRLEACLEPQSVFLLKISKKASYDIHQVSNICIDANSI